MKYQLLWLKSFDRRVAPKGMIFTVCSFVLSLMSDYGLGGKLRKEPLCFPVRALTSRQFFTLKFATCLLQGSLDVRAASFCLCSGIKTQTLFGIKLKVIVCWVITTAGYL